MNDNFDAVVALLDEAATEIALDYWKDDPRTVIVLGRDAWPLVPVLKEKFCLPVQYFVMSRLQLGDPETERQWLWETPPGSMVVDTGYAGSIINRLRQLDPTVVGRLMSSAVPDKYPSVCPAGRRSTVVGELEYSPKLIKRASGMHNGRLRQGGHMEAQHLSPKDTLRWNRRLCAALGVSEAWAKFTGYTPHARMGCKPHEVADRYAANLLTRLERELPVEPTPMTRESAVASYTWSSWTLKAAEKPAAVVQAVPTPPEPALPQGLTVKEEDGVTYALFDHMLMVDWDVDDGSHKRAKKQCLVDTAGEAYLRLNDWLAKPENEAYRFEFYLTPGGARAFCTSHFFHPADKEAQRILKELGCDKLYAGLCAKKGVWACRVSPKVGRKGDYVARWVAKLAGPAPSAKYPLVHMQECVRWHDRQCESFGGGYQFAPKEYAAMHKAMICF